MLRIYTYPDDILRNPAKEVENVDGALQEIIDKMAYTMYEAPGIGLAAPQIGITRRMIVIDVGEAEESTSQLYKLINPGIIGFNRIEKRLVFILI